MSSSNRSKFTFLSLSKVSPSNGKFTFLSLSKVSTLAGLLAVVLINSEVFADNAFKYNAKSKRDPFVPLVSGTGSLASDAYEASAVEDIRLEGIVWDDVKGSIAIINGEIVKEGDLIGSIKVLKIDKDSVIFVVDGENVKMNLNKE